MLYVLVADNDMYYVTGKRRKLLRCKVVSNKVRLWVSMNPYKTVENTCSNPMVSTAVVKHAKLILRLQCHKD
jgi:hypothetical protein